MVNHKRLFSKLDKKENFFIYVLILGSVVFGTIEYGLKTISISIIVFYSMYTIITNVIDWYFILLNWINRKETESNTMRKYYSVFSSIVVLLFIYILDEKIRSFLLIYCSIILVLLLLVHQIKTKLFKINNKI
jgi:hypothetical protein